MDKYTITEQLDQLKEDIRLHNPLMNYIELLDTVIDFINNIPTKEELEQLPNIEDKLFVWYYDTFDLDREALYEIFCNLAKYLKSRNSDLLALPNSTSLKECSLEELEQIQGRINTEINETIIKRCERALKGDF